MRCLSLGISPCPNDTSVFFGLLSGQIPLPGLRLHLRIEDVDTLNRLAFDRVLDVTKLSFYAYGQLRRDYALLRSGAALGRGCGPLVVARENLSGRCLVGKRIAVPGHMTTACLLLRLYGMELCHLEPMPFHAIAAAVASGAVDAGVLIHEARFTCEAQGLVKVLDLGSWWQTLTGLPLPLGCIVARRSLGRATLGQIEDAVRHSIDTLQAMPDAARDFIRRHAQENDDAVLDGHIGLYVNEFTHDLGAEGEAAVKELYARAEAEGLLPACSCGLFG
ncbi:1,4-dihydroxy-6-naphthoate synthase [Syntrophotalea carbinolica DSM 2380]|uniref:1,4-dihydroxy-6-naphtoate synthase n=1 Tax=Syntrophotalea carbinolica (strain DSM 2380 / NBRC 103641 / GraBd1) TaxID=338963 RepID=Q39ZV6_SYNC1|nr:1,4-dihydroxy-6-naphthoate synthase [Syntrophotalea carbinolica]ABA90351.1 1,4-dihydroxy-6-naphthoate synthase [Syntrophotalea carbinolica DSM 2380]